MDPTDQPADVVQPEDGQGDGGTGNPAYAEFLDRIPEDARPVAEEAFKAWDANWTRQSQDHSEYRKAWEPYEGAGVKQYDPEAVQNALSFYQAATTDPQAIKQWYEETYAPAHNLFPQPQPEQQQPPPDQFGQDPFGVDQGQQLADMLKQQLSPLQQQLEQLSSWRQQQEEQAAINAGQQVIDHQIAELKTKHGEEFSPTAQQWVMDRANTTYLNDPQNAIPRAWGDFQVLVNELSKQVLQSKVDAPAPAETGGTPNVAPEQYTRIDAAGVKDAALEFLRNSNRA